MSRRFAFVLMALSTMALLASSLAGCGSDDASPGGTTARAGTGRVTVIEFVQPG